MEEKERYVIRYDLDYNRCLIDTEKNQGVGDYIQIVKLLNQQSKRIKELEEELKNYKLCRCVDCSTEYEKGLETSIDELENENQQLKTQPAEIVEKIRNICSIEDKCKDGSFVLGINEKDLDNLLQEYQK